MKLSFFQKLALTTVLIGALSTGAHAEMEASPYPLQCGEVPLGMTVICGTVEWHWQPYSSGNINWTGYQITGPITIDNNPYDQFSLFDVEGCEPGLYTQPGLVCRYQVQVTALELGTHQGWVTIKGGPRAPGQSPIGHRIGTLRVTVVEAQEEPEEPGEPDVPGDPGELPVDPGTPFECQPDPANNRYCLKLPL